MKRKGAPLLGGVAAAEIVQRAAPLMRDAIRALVPERERDDIVQEATIAVLRRWPDVPEAPAARAAFFRRTAFLVALGSKARAWAKRVELLPEAPEVPQDEPSEPRALALSLPELQRACRPEDWRIFEAMALDGLPGPAAAAKEGIPQATAYNRLRLARRDIAAALARAPARREPQRPAVDAIWALFASAYHEAAHAVVGALTGLRPSQVQAMTDAMFAAGKGGETAFRNGRSTPLGALLDAPMLCAGYFGSLRAMRPLAPGQRAVLRASAANDWRDVQAFVSLLPEHDRARFVRSAALCAGRLVRRYWTTIVRLANAVVNDTTIVQGRRLASLLASPYRARWQDTHAGREWRAALARL